MRRHHILIPLAALCAILPLILHGCSCGHDMDFHLQSWLDAAQQLHHGTLYPRWIVSAAFNAGEPRFTFYPPLSWFVGALLLGVLHTLHFSIAAAPAIYTFLCLTAAGFAMHRLASHFTSPNAALLASALYLANPYMLFNVYERTAYAELLAAAWIPLLLLAIFRRRPTIPGIAIPIALLWLTNAPAAVMGCYTFALLATLRLAYSFLHRNPSPLTPPTLTPHPVISTEAQRSGETCFSPLRLTTTLLTGTALGLALPAFYLLPAAYERRYVQIAMAIIPNMRFEDNFLFTRTTDEPHNLVLHTVSLLAVILVALTLVATLILLTRKPSLAARSSQLEAVSPTCSPQFLAISLITLTAIIAFLLTPPSTPIWHHLPNLAFLQFPWRLLTILSAILAFTLALLFHQLTRIPGAPPSRASSKGWGIALCATALLSTLALTFLANHLYRQPCYEPDLPQTVANLFTTHHGVVPTDEYTPTNADNDVLRSDDPAFWLSPNPAAFAPNTIPNPAIATPGFDGDIPPDQTISYPAPHHLAVNAPQPETLILNLRNFPNWQITETDPGSMGLNHPQPIPRDDGLLAIPIPAGPSTIDITWRPTPDQTLGYFITALALVALLCITLQQRTSAPSH